MNEVALELLLSCKEPNSGNFFARKSVLLPGYPSRGDVIYLSNDDCKFKIESRLWRESDTVLLRLESDYPTFEDLDSLKKIENSLIDNGWEIEIQA
ncbi:hypothetical protein [Gimesia aquarii]|uniref:Uncharacterized protein n=1 Tax=Gimesia aquarii TaxID=2527964 RepID=A0A517X2X6_9PLAN|nr:hypothetical protein [Gimesia aquarii]QDU11863.1 hypothetical protein V202x_52880 [Gimesia aquarii]